MTDKPRFPVLGVLICLGVLSVCIQYVTITKLWVLPPSQPYGTLGEFLAAVEEKQIPFGALDGMLAGLFLLAAAALLYGEFRHRALTGFLRHCFDSPRRTLWLLAASLLVCGRFYFARGDPTWAADASHHLIHAWTAARAIADGQLPVWTFSIGAGSPVYHTYGFVFFYLSGLVDLVLGDFYLSLKLIMGAAHVLSGLGMYLLAASLCRSRPAGFVAGLAYALCFWPTQHVLLMGRFPLSLFYAFLPWWFRSCHGPRPARWSCGSGRAARCSSTATSGTAGLPTLKAKRRMLILSYTPSWMRASPHSGPQTGERADAALPRRGDFEARMLPGAGGYT